MLLPGAMLGHNVDPALRAAWLEDMFLPPDVLEWALSAVRRRRIICDSLCGTRIFDWGVPRCGNLNIAALLSGVVCDIRVT